MGGTIMNKLLLTTAFLAAFGATPVKALTITVDDIGSLLNESVPLPAHNTPGSGIGFEQFFEFTLPVAETVTVSMSDSAVGSGRITGGLLSLSDWTSTGSTPPFVPMGALLESASIVNVVGGQEATVTPDGLAAGAYFAEISGLSGASALKIAVDGTATATVPEASTWAMAAIGFAFLAAFGLRRQRGARFAF
jgi:hypothetical protein